jgi:hypothetical protein
MIGAGSGEPEARRRRRMAAIAAPPASNAAGQSQTATGRERLLAAAGALEAFEPPAAPVAASPGLDTGFGHRSALLADRTRFEGDAARAPGAGRASWSVAWVGRRVGKAWTAARAARCARLTEPAPRSSSEAPVLPALGTRATATGAAGAAGALAAGGDALTAGAGGAGAGGGAGVTAGGGVGAVGGATGAGRNSSGSTWPFGSSVRLMPRWTYGTSCSTSPLGPIVPTAPPSPTVSPRRTLVEPRCVRVTE